MMEQKRYCIQVCRDFLTEFEAGKTYVCQKKGPKILSMHDGFVDVQNAIGMYLDITTQI